MDRGPQTSAHLDLYIKIEITFPILEIKKKIGKVGYLLLGDVGGMGRGRKKG